MKYNNCETIKKIMTKLFKIKGKGSNNGNAKEEAVDMEGNCEHILKSIALQLGNEVKDEKSQSLSKSRKLSGGIATLMAGICCMTVIMSGFVGAYRIVTIKDGGSQIVYRTLKTSTSGMLKEKNITLDQEDEVDVNDDGHDILIEITRAVNVKVKADGQQKAIKISPKLTVGDALNKVGVTLGEQDMVSVEQTQKVSEGLDVVINRVNTSDRVFVESLEHGQEEKKTSSLFVGQSKFIGGGHDGEITHYYRDVLVDGQVTESVEIGSRVTKQPQNDVVLIGTKKRVSQKPAVTKAIVPALGIQLDSNGIPIDYKDVVTGRATAYTGGGTTSTGRVATPGLVAVDPNVIPYGTRMYIVSQNGFVYGSAIAADTGGAMRSGAVLMDLYMNTAEECIRFGSRIVNIYIL